MRIVVVPRVVMKAAKDEQTVARAEAPPEERVRRKYK